MKLTAREKDVLLFIVSYRRENDISPTLREIGEGLHLRSPSTVHRYVTSLTDKGYLQRRTDKMRTLVPIEERLLAERLG